MKRIRFSPLTAVAGILLAATTAWSATPYAVTLERNVAVKMRDGVTLRADIYRPAAEGKFPVLLTRTPYNKDGNVNFGLRAAAQGYVVIAEDCRGRYASEGDWYTFRYESQDGYDTVEWAAALPYSDGKVGMFGGSYVGATQMLTAIAHPPHLAGICPYVTASNYHDGWTYQGGAFEQWFNESWTSGLAQNTLFRFAVEHTNALLRDRNLPLDQYPLYNFDKLPRGAERTHLLAPYFLDWLAHPSYDNYWKQWSIEDNYSNIQVPSLNIGAWYDIFLGGTLRNYVGLKQKAGNETARRGQRLMVTIGGHAGSGRRIGDLDFGPSAEFDTDGVILEWYDYLLKGVQNKFAGPKPVEVFVLGANEWRQLDDWPMPQAQSTRYYLHSGGKANSLRGDGRLTTAAPAAEPADEYVYDPSNPVATIGGPLCCDATHLPAGPRDQRPAEAREDVLVYSTEPFAQNTEVTGPVQVELYVKSSAVDTDFTAKLVDVWPDGYAQNLTEGIIRARYRNSQERVELLTPGEVYRFHIDLWSTSNVFQKGHRLRVEISSSNSPRFDRNLNTGEIQSSARRSVSATNTVLHDAKHPSALVVSVVPAR